VVSKLVVLGNYFGIGNVKKKFQRLDEWMRMRVRAYMRQKKSKVSNSLIPNKVLESAGMVFLVRDNQGLKDFIGSQTALGRVGEADDIGGVVASLCTDDMGWVNAQRIEASGGMFL
jgi:hypothetical protein